MLCLGAGVKLNTMRGHFFRNIKGLTYRFHWNVNGYDIDVKLNDAYAKINGFKDLGDLLAGDDAIAFENLIEKCGKVPKYLPLRVNGKESDIVKAGKQIEAYLNYVQNL